MALHPQQLATMPLLSAIFKAALLKNLHALPELFYVVDESDSGGELVA